MGKREFLEILSERLSEELPRSMVIGHLQYYEDYIESEVRAGRAMSEIMEELGDPVMIAHTIINTETGESFQGYAEEGEFVEIPSEEEVSQEPVYEEVEYTHLHTESEAEYQSKEIAGESKMDQKMRNISVNLGGFAAIALVLLIVVGILMLIGGIIGALLPILIPLLLIMFVVSLVTKRR